MFFAILFITACSHFLLCDLLLDAESIVWFVVEGQTRFTSDLLKSPDSLILCQRYAYNIVFVFLLVRDGILPKYTWNESLNSVSILIY